MCEAVAAGVPDNDRVSYPELPDVLPGKVRSKLRYIGGYCITKVKYRNTQKLKKTLAGIPAQTFTADTMKQELFAHLTASESEIATSTSDKESLKETTARQGNTRGLTNIKDAFFSFFMEVY